MNWSVIEGYEGIYAISDDGQVMAMNYHYSKLPGLMTARLMRGYPYVNLTRNGIQKTFAVHRLVALSFIGHRPKGMQINHKNGIKTDNRVENLEYVTASRNMSHAYETGLHSLKGERNTQSKLTETLVREIRRRHATGLETHTKIAKDLGVSRPCVSLVISRKNWDHVPDETH